MSNYSNFKGKISEHAVLEYLTNNGLRLITQNFYSRFGEIDLIMWDHSVLVFIEVKLRKSGISDGIWSITPLKQRKMVRTANFYLVKLGREVACRFDAVIVDGNNHYEWLKNIIVL